MVRLYLSTSTARRAAVITPQNTSVAVPASYLDLAAAHFPAHWRKKRMNVNK